VSGSIERCHATVLPPATASGFAWLIFTTENNSQGFARIASQPSAGQRAEFPHKKFGHATFETTKADQLIPTP
jgi:hypothetical protein